MLMPIEKSFPVNRIPWITYGLIVLNVVVFAFTEFYFETLDVFHQYGFISVEPEWRTAFTSMFLHNGLLHLIGNMFFLWMYGDNVEDTLGSWLFAVSYVLLGIAAVGIYYLVRHSSALPLVGASGAISGVMGLYWIFYPHVHTDLHLVTTNRSIFVAHLSARGAILTWLAVQFVFALITLKSQSGTAFSAHIGGLLCGMAMGYGYRNYFRITPAKPSKLIEIRRNRVTDIWCPYCGYKEMTVEYRDYQCPSCDILYRVVRSSSHKKPPIDYKDQSNIDFESLHDLKSGQVPLTGFRSQLTTEEDGIQYQFKAYIYNSNGLQKLLVTVVHDAKEKVYLEHSGMTQRELDLILRSETRFVLSDFEPF